MLALLDRVLAQSDTLDLERSITVVDQHESVAVACPSRTDPRRASRARPVPDRLRPQARAAPARTPRQGSRARPRVRHGARMDTPDPPARLAPGVTEGAAMGDELRPDRDLARHRGALLAGQEPRRLWPPGSPGAGRPADVARGLQNGRSKKSSARMPDRSSRPEVGSVLRSTAHPDEVLR